MELKKLNGSCVERVPSLSVLRGSRLSLLLGWVENTGGGCCRFFFPFSARTSCLFFINIQHLFVRWRCFAVPVGHHSPLQP